MTTSLAALPDYLLPENVEEILVTSCKSDRQKPPYYSLFVSRSEILLVETSAVQMNSYRYDCTQMVTYFNDHEADLATEDHFTQRVAKIGQDLDKGIAQVYEKPKKQG